MVHVSCLDKEHHTKASATLRYQQQPQHLRSNWCRVFYNTCDSKHVSNNAWRNTGCLSVTDSPQKNYYYRILYISTIFFKHDFERNSCYHWCFCFILKALLHMVLCYLIKWCNKMLSQKGALSSSLLIWGNSNSYSLRPKSAKTHMSCDSLW